MHHPSQLFVLSITIGAIGPLIPRFSAIRTFSFGSRGGYESTITGCKCICDRLEWLGNLSHGVVGNESRNRILGTFFGLLSQIYRKLFIYLMSQATWGKRG